MVPYNNNYSPVKGELPDAKEIVKLVDRPLPLKQPIIDQSTGLCIVCGMKRNEGHGWPCIIYLMKMAVSAYERRMQLTEFLLNKILAQSNIPKEEVEHVLEEIKAARDLINSVGD